MTSDFPLDATGEVLQNMKAHGVDFSKDHDVEFVLVFDEGDAAAQCAEAIERLGVYQVQVYQDDENDRVDLIASRTMRLDHATISEAERELADLARPYGGSADGWGTLQD